MASLFFLVKFVSSEIMMIELHNCWWHSIYETAALSYHIQMLKRCSEYLTVTSLSQNMSYAEEMCNSEHGCRSHPRRNGALNPNYFRLHTDAEKCMWKTNLETKFLPLVRRRLNRWTLLPARVRSVSTTQKHWLCGPHEKCILWCLSSESYQVWDYNILTLICGWFQEGTNSTLSEWDSKQFCWGTNHSIKADRGEDTAASHCVFQLTGTQSWGAPCTGGVGEAREQCGSSIRPSVWAHGRLSDAFSSYLNCIFLTVSPVSWEVCRECELQSQKSCNLSGHCCTFPEATWKTFLVPSTYGKSAQYD